MRAESVKRTESTWTSSQSSARSRKAMTMRGRLERTRRQVPPLTQWSDIPGRARLHSRPANTPVAQTWAITRLQTPKPWRARAMERPAKQRLRTTSGRRARSIRSSASK
jgi:hypothetical protein